MNKNPTRAVALAGLGAVIVAWAGATLYSHSAVESRIQGLAANPAPLPGVRIANLTHHSGWTTSDGEFDLVVGPTCGGVDEPAGHVSYQVSHVVMPTSVNRFKWKLQPKGQGAQAFARMFGPDASLTGEGSVGMGGTVATSVQIPALALTDGKKSANIPASNATVSVGARSLALDWLLPKASISDGNAPVALENAGVHIDIHDTTLGTGKTSISIERLMIGAQVVEGLELTSSVESRGDALDARFRPSMRKAHFADHELENVAVEFALTNLDRANAAKLAPKAPTQCAVAPTEPARSELAGREALGGLLHHGFSLGISQLSGRLDQATLDGSLTLTLKPTPSDPGARIDLVQALEASGQIGLKGPIPKFDIVETLVEAGYLTKTQDSLNSKLQFAGGTLKVNDVVVDAAPIAGTLALLGEGINGALADQAARASRAPLRRPIPAGIPIDVR